MAVNEDAVQQLAVNVGLLLACCCIADSDRKRPPVSFQSFDLHFTFRFAAANVIQNLELLRWAVNGFLKKMEESVGFFVIAAMHERRQHKLRISDPGKAIVPVLTAADDL